MVPPKCTDQFRRCKARSYAGSSGFAYHNGGSKTSAWDGVFGSLEEAMTLVAMNSIFLEVRPFCVILPRASMKSPVAGARKSTES